MEKISNKKSFYLFIKIFIVVLISGILIGGIFIYAFVGGIKLNIYINNTYQTIEGFGASSAWFSQEIGAYQGVDSDLFKKQATEYLYGDAGLRLNTYRYNIGAGSWDLYKNDVGDYRCEDRRTAALTESFFIPEKFSGDYSVFADINNYDVSRDQNAVSMLKMALDTNNISKIVLFLNSPYYAFTKNGMCLGNDDDLNNLKAECFDAYSDYVMMCSYILYEEVIKPYNIDSSKIFLSPVNEPQWDWTFSTSDQEGCHYDPDYLAKFYDKFYLKLNYWNSVWSTNFVLDIFECGSYSENEDLDIYDYLSAFKTHEFFKALDTISIHSYWVGENKEPKRRLKNKIHNYNVYNLSISEYCDMISGRDYSINMAIRDAQIINRDLTILNAISWSWWLGVSDEDFNSSLVYYDIDDKNTQNDLTDDTYTFTVPKRYYALKHYSYFISEGDKRVQISSSDALGLKKLDYSAFIKPDGSLIVVIINADKPQKIQLKSVHYEYMDTFLTTSEYDWKVENGKFKRDITIPSNAILTIKLYN